jgi:hypothetical protein
VTRIGEIDNGLNGSVYRGLRYNPGGRKKPLTGWGVKNLFFKNVHQHIEKIQHREPVFCSDFHNNGFRLID